MNTHARRSRKNPEWSAGTQQSVQWNHMQPFPRKGHVAPQDVVTALCCGLSWCQWKQEPESEATCSTSVSHTCLLPNGLNFSPTIFDCPSYCAEHTHSHYWREFSFLDFRKVSKYVFQIYMWSVLIFNAKIADALFQIKTLVQDPTSVLQSGACVFFHYVFSLAKMCKSSAVFSFFTFVCIGKWFYKTWQVSLEIVRPKFPRADKSFRGMFWSFCPTTRWRRPCVIWSIYTMLTVLHPLLPNIG